MYLEIPTVTTSTPAERLEALQDAKELMSGSGSSGIMAAFGASKNTPGSSADAINGFIRLAEYITTGHDYPDTHPEGKRRPIIKQVTNVTVMAPPTLDTEELDHFLHHVENGDFADFIKDMVNGQSEPDTEPDTEPEEADGEESAVREDEPEHRPVDPDDRPRFA